MLYVYKNTNLIIQFFPEIMNHSQTKQDAAEDCMWLLLKKVK